MKTIQKLLSLIIITLILNILSVTNGQSKNSYSISGVLLDSLSKQPIEYAAVAIYNLRDTSLITGTITNPKGEFTITNLPPGKLLIKSSFIGYKNKITNVEINNVSVNLTLPILMNSSSIYLNAVTVTGQQNEKQINIEKTKINVAQNIGSVSGNVTDLLKSQSSISIDADNSIYLRGNGNILILMDGRPTTLATLNSIPSSGIESIEIVTNPDAKYDAEGTGGIINIVMKNQVNSGLNGTITLNYGVNKRVNGGFKMNYSRDIWDMGFSYNGKYENSNIQSNLTRQLFSQPVYLSQEINSNQIMPAHTSVLLLSVKPSNKDIITLGLKLFLPDVLNTQNISSKQVNDTLPAILLNRRNEVTFSRKTFEGAIYYKTIFEKNRNEISFDGSYSRTEGSRPAEYFINNEFLERSDGGGAPTNAVIQVDYLKSIFDAGKIELGIKAFSRWNNFNYNFYDFDTTSNLWTINPGYSNDLEHKEYIYSCYLMYSDNLLRNLYYKAGMRIEYNTSELIQKLINYQSNKEFLFPFPYLLIKYNIDKIQDIAFSINRRITRPTYPQLNPFIIVIDQMTYETGNKNLYPEIMDKAEFNHSWIKENYQLNSSIYYSTTKDFITQVSLLSNPDKLIVTYVNGSRQNKIGGDFDTRYKFNKIFSINPGFSIFYIKSTGRYNEIDLSTNNLAWAGNIKTIIKPEENTELQILLNYNSPIDLPQFDLSSIYYADVAVKRSFFNNKLSLSMTLNDVFNTRKWYVQSENHVFKLNNSSKNESRIFWFGITYNIDSYKSTENQKTEGTENEREVIKIGQ
jgi:outer membrane receptor protein involved in Fe transport